MHTCWLTNMICTCADALKQWAMPHKEAAGEVVWSSPLQQGQRERVFCTGMFTSTSLPDK